MTDAPAGRPWGLISLALLVVLALGFSAHLARSGAPSLDDLRAGTLPTGKAPAPMIAPVAQVDTTGTQPDPGWIVRTARGTGIPMPAVRAYGRAQILLGLEQPGCHLGWTTLAGIGWVESRHGTIGGRALMETGRSSNHVRGPTLDGSTYAAVPEGSGWARAIGPMQFLGSTWSRWGADGDGDGRSDVEDVDDASLAAGRYLCADGHDLATATGWNAGVLSYNHSGSYVLSVYRAAETYQGRSTS